MGFRCLELVRKTRVLEKEGVVLIELFWMVDGNGDRRQCMVTEAFERWTVVSGLVVMPFHFSPPGFEKGCYFVVNALLAKEAR